MNWKSILTTAVAVVVGMILYDRFVKSIVAGGLEGNYFDYDSYVEA